MSKELEQTIVDYFKSDQDFFIRHPELLTEMGLSFRTDDGVVPIADHQLKVLREEVAQGKQQLKELIDVAKENEELNQRLHRLTLTLLDTVEFEEAVEAAQDKLYQEFKAEAVEFHLFSRDEEAANPTLDGFKEFFDAGAPKCGVLSSARLSYLFGPQAEDIQSTALVPIHSESLLGVLAIGSRDPKRFHPDKGTEYLVRLGEIVSKALEVVSEPGF